MSEVSKPGFCPGGKIPPRNSMRGHSFEYLIFFILALLAALCLAASVVVGTNESFDSDGGRGRSGAGDRL